MNSQPTLDFENNEEKKLQPVNTITETISVNPERKKTIRETSVDKFKAKKHILITEIYSQIDAVLYQLQQEGSITSMDGFTEWGITCMSAIIYTLRHAPHNIDIIAEDITITNRFGHNTTFSKYKLKKETPPPQA